MKYGDIDISELQMKTYDKDTSAAAVVLGDFGEITIKYDEIQRSFHTIFVKHTRVKILKKDGYSWSDHAVDLYHDADIMQKISGVSGTTYNLENGKISKSKLTKDSQFTEKVSDYWDTFKFTMPDVKEGSVIEFRYLMESDYLLTLPVWNFQYSIPVVWSELKISIPEYYTYNRTLTGYDPFYIDETTTGKVNLSFTQKENVSDDNFTVKNEYRTSNINYTTNNSRMVVKDVPAFKDEPYLTSAENYIMKATYELARVWFPESEERLYTESWETINKKMLENENFGLQLKAPSLFINDKVDEINASTNDPVEKIRKIHEFVKDHMKWNDKNSCYTTLTLRSAFNEKSGNAADINLLLTQMLKKAGLDANPVILSTRSNGLINAQFPILSQFNYIIASVNNSGRLYLLDATDPNCTPDLLPQRCLNGNGLLIDEKGPRWIMLNPEKKYEYTSKADLVLDETGKIEGSITNLRNDYGAYMLRQSMDEQKSEDDFIEELEKDNPGLEFTEYNFLHRKEIYEPMTEEYKVNINGYADLAGDYIYCNPLLTERIKSNPFRLEVRKYPIDFGYPIAQIYNLNLKVPEGYEVQEIPEPLQLSLPGNSASFLYKIEVLENGNLNLINELKINKSVFLYDEYPLIKEFYSKIVQKHAESIVFKRTN